MSLAGTARYTFLPWVRQGAARNITTVDNPQANLEDYATFDVTVQANTAPAETVKVALYGPGYVTGFDQRQVVRTDPPHLTSGFEPNYFPTVEFDRPDFPWLFTPAAANQANRLRPWICMVVVPNRPPRVSLGPGTPLPVLSIKKVPPDNLPAANELPDLAESWAWAHAQVAGSLMSGQTLDDVLVNSPERTVSRLICPRVLQPNTSYYACVVPTFKAGRLAGLGQPPADTKLGPAWDPQEENIELPVYYHWEFSTGAAGDFESLAKLLERRDPPAGAGNQDMDIGNAGTGLPQLPPDAPGSVLGLEGALRSPGTGSTPWPEPARTNFRSALRDILDAPMTLRSTNNIPGVVAPPIYGGFHAGRSTVPEDPLGRLQRLLWGISRFLTRGSRTRPDHPNWLRELNLDPRYRAVAGIGTRVIQEEQEPLMAAAWEQVGEIERANQLLRQAQLARSVGNVIHEEHLAPLGAGSLLQITEAVHPRVMMSPYTLQHQISRSALPQSSLTPEFRRATRPRGPLARRAAAEGERRVRPLVERLNDGEISAAPPRKSPDGTVSLDQVSDSLYPSFVPRWLRRYLPYSVWVVLALSLLSVLLAVRWLRALGIVPALLVAVAAWIRRQTPRWRVANTMRPTELRPETVAVAPGRPGFTVVPEGATEPPSPSREEGRDSPQATLFRAAAEAHQEHLIDVVETPEPPPAPPLDLRTVRPTLLTRLDPAQTVPAAVLASIEVDLDAWDPDDPIEPIMAAPEFPTPMYEPLRQIAKDLLMPGVDEIQPNTITLLETNPRFIESYMVGLNHEMSRELLWREFPTDQRGTYFRQFWDPRSHVPPPTTEAERDELRDITPIHTWPKSNDLGETASSGKPEGMLVLLIRGELLLRYPTAIIYASKADRPPNVQGRKPLEGAAKEERYPIFRGTFPPDITFLGFDLSEREARGGPAPPTGADDPGPGWFFVLQQQPTEPRFGLDASSTASATPSPTTGPGSTPFSDLSWDDVKKNGHIDVDETGKDPKISVLRGPLGQSWGSHSADMAYITLQRPYRVAISADDMLPGRPRG